MVIPTTDMPSKTNTQLIKSIIKEKEHQVADMYLQLTMKKRIFKMDLNSTVKLCQQESMIAAKEKMELKESELLKLIDHSEKYARDILQRNIDEERKKTRGTKHSTKQ